MPNTRKLESQLKAPCDFFLEREFLCLKQLWNLDLCSSLAGPSSSSLHYVAAVLLPAGAYLRCLSLGSAFVRWPVVATLVVNKVENHITQCSHILLYIMCTWHSLVKTLMSDKVYSLEFKHDSPDVLQVSYVVLTRSVFKARHKH